MTLEEKIEKAKETILEASKKWDSKEIAIAWTGGKDSTVILHLVKEIFDGEIPFRVMFNDSTIEFPEVYDFINNLKDDWSLDLIWQKHLPSDLEAYEKTTDKEQQMEIMRIAASRTIWSSRIHTTLLMHPPIRN